MNQFEPRSIPAFWRVCVYTAVLLLAGCSRPAPAASASSSAARQSTVVMQPGLLQPRRIRLTGSVAAVRSLTIRPPRIQGSNPMMTVTYLAANGARVKQGDILAAFDPTQEIDNARQAKAKYDDLSHQVDQKVAQNRSDAEQRASALKQAQSDLDKARLELRKAPILSEIDADKAKVNRQDAAAHVASLRRSDHLQDQADAAALKILELQRDRQRQQWQRAQENVVHMKLSAPLSGIVALQSSFRNGSFGPAQEGDKIWSGNPLLSIFDPGQMTISASLNEADDFSITPGMKAAVHLDAYPDAVFSAHVESLSPVATAPLGSPVRSFTLILRFDQPDPRLMPDLAAAVDLTLPPPPRALLAPRSAVRFLAGQAYVRGADGNSPQWLPVQLGAFDDASIEVLAGLRAGERIQAHPAELVRLPAQEGR